ncbi:hypothetical protein ON010_g5906 [Phytophthora cinnamomi]|nr:hypothetical protein ON010_g5906 [Phytophthora cinnamomi]
MHTNDIIHSVVSLLFTNTPTQHCPSLWRSAATGALRGAVRGAVPPHLPRTEPARGGGGRTQQVRAAALPDVVRHVPGPPARALQRLLLAQGVVLQEARAQHVDGHRAGHHPQVHVLPLLLLPAGRLRALRHAVQAPARGRAAPPQRAQGRLQGALLRGQGRARGLRAHELQRSELPAQDHAARARQERQADTEGALRQLGARRQRLDQLL